MKLALFIYLVEAAANLDEFLKDIVLILSILLFISLFLIPAAMDCFSEEKFYSLKKYFKLAVVVLIVAAAIRVFIPSKKAMYAMAGAYAVQKGIESETFKRLNSKVFALLEQKIDSALESEGEKEAEDKKQ
ncbi:hypothetical protein [Bdellovibrio bacteriovorus]|uniref:hypothetical protein n=1 Tax=Bdellovibrio bacteriovorus TaxID=959 RepID=UPI0035A5F4D3